MPERDKTYRIDIEYPVGCDAEPMLVIDYNGDTHGGVVDLLSTSVMSGNMLKVLIWYDNEAGFTNQLLRLITMVAGKM